VSKIPSVDVVVHVTVTAEIGTVGQLVKLVAAEDKERLHV